MNPLGQEVQTKWGWIQSTMSKDFLLHFLASKINREASNLHWCRIFFFCERVKKGKVPSDKEAVSWTLGLYMSLPFIESKVHLSFSFFLSHEFKSASSCEQCNALDCQIHIRNLLTIGHVILIWRACSSIAGVFVTNIWKDEKLKSRNSKRYWDLVRLSRLMICGKGKAKPHVRTQGGCEMWWWEGGGSPVVWNVCAELLAFEGILGVGW